MSRPCRRLSGNSADPDFYEPHEPNLDEAGLARDRFVDLSDNSRSKNGMTRTALIQGLSAIAANYDAILCDVWGVIHDGRKGFQPAVKALREFRSSRGPVVLITNAPVPKERVTRLFPGLGVPEDCFDDVVSSGDATRNELKRVAPGPVYRIEHKEDRGLYEGLPLQFSDDPAVAKVISCTSLREYPHGTPEPYREELTRLAGRGLPMICANPDVQFRHGDRLVWSAGSLARIYE